MVGYDPDMEGGSWQLASGRSLAGDDEVVLERVMAQEHGIKAGDEIDILGESFTVVGLSDGTNSWMASFFFIEKAAAERVLLAPGANSFLLLTLEPGRDIKEVEADIRRLLEDVEVVSAETRTSL